MNKVKQNDYILMPKALADDAKSVLWREWNRAHPDDPREAYVTWDTIKAIYAMAVEHLSKPQVTLPQDNAEKITAGRLESFGYTQRSPNGSVWLSPTDGLDVKEVRFAITCWSINEADSVKDHRIIDSISIYSDQAMSEPGRYVEHNGTTIGDLRRLHKAFGQVLREGK